jgi:hypothetical protein
MRLLFAVLLIPAMMVNTAIAQIPSAENGQSHAAAVRLVEALNWRRVMEPVRAEMLGRAKTNLQSTLREELGSPTAEEYAEVEAMIDQLASKYTLDDTIADIVPLLQAHYSTAEMEDLAILLASPFYKKFQAELPRIDQEALEIVKRKMQPAIQDTTNRVFQRVDEMKRVRSAK